MDELSGNESVFAAARRWMVEEQLSEFPPAIRAAMERVPRHEFVPEDKHSLAYADRAVSIGYDQTISQPYIVALMTAQLDPKPGDRILEIGTGSGYQAAVLAELGTEIFTIEIIELLAQRAAKTLQRLGYGSVRVRPGDGYQGWPEASPFDAVTVTCAPKQIPPPLIAQLKEGGRMVIPIGPLSNQKLLTYQKLEGQLVEKAICAVRFVPMTGLTESNS